MIFPKSKHRICYLSFIAGWDFHLTSKRLSIVLAENWSRSHTQLHCSSGAAFLCNLFGFIWLSAIYGFAKFSFRTFYTSSCLCLFAIQTVSMSDEQPWYGSRVLIIIGNHPKPRQWKAKLFILKKGKKECHMRSRISHIQHKCIWINKYQMNVQI